MGEAQHSAHGTLIRVLERTPDVRANPHEILIRCSSCVFATLSSTTAWDPNLGVWTAEAIRGGYRSRVIDEFSAMSSADTSPAQWGSSFGSTGIVVNCPIVARLL